MYSRKNIIINRNNLLKKKNLLIDYILYEDFDEFFNSTLKIQVLNNHKSADGLYIV